MSLRIIGGNWRSRKLLRPDTPATRPMPDRVKQSIFNILGCRYETPGLLPPLRVADVFAGSGSMGFEALSRGASHCTFYEADRVVLSTLRANQGSLDAKEISRIVTGNAWKNAARDAGGGTLDLVFLDPPYVESNDNGPEGPLSTFLQNLAENVSRSEVRLFPLIVLHHFAKVRYSTMKLAVPWTIVDERKIGSNAVTIFAEKP